MNFGNRGLRRLITPRPTRASGNAASKAARNSVCRSDGDPMALSLSTTSRRVSEFAKSTSSSFGNLAFFTRNLTASFSSYGIVHETRFEYPFEIVIRGFFSAFLPIASAISSTSASVRSQTVVSTLSGLLACLSLYSDHRRRGYSRSRKSATPSTTGLSLYNASRIALFPDSFFPTRQVRASTENSCESSMHLKF